LRKSPNPKDPRPHIVKRIQEEKHSEYKPTKEKMKLSRKDKMKAKHLYRKLERKEKRRWWFRRRNKKE